MKKRRGKLDRSTEARRRARASGAKPGATRVIENKRKRPEKHKRRWLETEMA